MLYRHSIRSFFLLRCMHLDRERFPLKHIRFIVLVALFLTTGILYGTIPPMLEKIDEEGHYEYVLFLQKHRSLPPLIPQAGYRQPPLYYVVAAFLTGWLAGSEDDLSRWRLNPYVAHSVPGCRNDNRNVFLHPPYMTPAFLGARMVSLLFGLGTLLLTYFFVRTLVPSRPLLAIATAAVTGFHPQFLYITTATHNDSGIIFCSALVLFLLARYIRRPSDNLLALVLLGGALGLAVLAKVSGLLLIPLTLIVVVTGQRKWMKGLQNALVVLAVAFLIGGWWYLRNGILFGDPLTIESHVASSPGERVRRISEIFTYDLPSIEYTFWANISRSFVSPLLLDQVLIVWGRVGLLVGLLALVEKRKWLKEPLVLVTVVGWPAAYLFALLFYWNSKAAWGFGRLILPALPSLALLFVIGWDWIARNVLRNRWLFPTAIGVVVVSGVFIPPVSLYPLYRPYRPWHSTGVSEWPGIIYVDLSEGQPFARLVDVRPLQAYAHPGMYAPLEICWEPLGNTLEPLPMAVSLLDISPTFSGNPPASWGYRETYPGLGNAPTDRWMSFAPFCDRVLIWVSPEAPAPLCPAIEVRFVDQGNVKSQALDGKGSALGLALAGRLPILHENSMLSSNESPSYILDNRIGLYPPQVSFDQRSVSITMTWQALQKIPYDATVFVHLMDAEGNLLAQQDQQPLRGRFPTSCWLPGQVVTDVITLTHSLSENVAPMKVRMGMYTWPLLERLEVVDASGQSLPERAVYLELREGIGDRR